MIGALKKIIFTDLRLPTWTTGKAVVSALVFVVCLICFAPTLRTLWWHLRNGDSIAYKGRTIPIPLEWIAIIEPQGTQITKWHRTVLSHQPLSGFITFHSASYPNGEGHDEIARSWEAHYWAGQAETDDVVSGPFKISSPAGEVLCMEAYSKKYPEHASAACLMSDINLNASFGGERKDIDVFLQLIREMK